MRNDKGPPGHPSVTIYKSISRRERDTGSKKLVGPLFSYQRDKTLGG